MCHRFGLHTTSSRFLLRSGDALSESLCFGLLFPLFSFLHPICQRSLPLFRILTLLEAWQCLAKWFFLPYLKNLLPFYILLSQLRWHRGLANELIVWLQIWRSGKDVYFRLPNCSRVYPRSMVVSISTAGGILQLFLVLDMAIVDLICPACVSHPLDSLGPALGLLQWLHDAAFEA